MEFIAIEGNTQRLDGGAMFGNAPKAMWSRWIKPDDNNSIPLACRVLLLKTDDGKNILFEAGVGAFFDPKMKARFGVVEEEHVLIKNLEAHGLSDEDIDVVILSHLHFDHAGGVLSAFGDGESRLLFPNATFYTGKEHWERATHPHQRDRASFIPLIAELLEKSGRLKLIEGDSHPDLDFGLSFRYAHGHTPGMLISVIDCDEGPLVFVADLIPARPWMHVPITMGYDRFPELVIDEKKAFLEDMEKLGAKLFLTHDPEVAYVEIQRDEKGKYVGKEISLSASVS
ncbi:Probable quorum-quenching lactonase YtnP [Chlamydiales bacterium SCGC AG-110-M15]|nr:Probable quorum-quenching lactonase YtnP [Chlamydiales bacterium SCGC AG-110-M15]